MIDKNLLGNVSKLGLPLFEVEHNIDVNKTLSEVIMSKNMRLWEGFPVLLANAAKEGFDYHSIANQLKTEDDKHIFFLLFSMSCAFYKYEHIKFAWLNKLYKELTIKDKDRIKEFSLFFKTNNEFTVAQKQLDPQRIKKMFTSYYKEKDINMNRLTPAYNELSLEYALSQTFSPKQKELFFKKLHGEKLTRTEIEYFSRVVKKKVMTLAHPEVHRLAQKLLRKE